MDELFDLYDEQDNPLGETKLRSAVHRDGDWHRTVHIYVMNLNGEILVHLRSPHKDMSPNKWDARFGGHVTIGMGYDETALREMHEELGLTIDIQDLHLLSEKSSDEGINKEHIRIYYYLFMGDDSELHFNDGEVVSVKWMAPETIIQQMKSDSQQWSGSADQFQLVLEKFKNI